MTILPGWYCAPDIPQREEPKPRPRAHRPFTPANKRVKKFDRVAYMKRYRREHRARKKETTKAWNLANPEAVKRISRRKNAVQYAKRKGIIYISTGRMDK
jgi:hypothetical protein